MRSQTQQSPSEHVNQRLEDRPSNVVLNKRIRASVADIRGEGQSDSFLRHSFAVGKDRDIKDGGKGCDNVKVKIRKLPAGRETCDRKMRRKRSLGTVFSRPIDGEGELKRVMHPKLTNGSPQSSDAQDLRPGYSGSNSKLNVTSMPASSDACPTSKDEQEKGLRDSMDGSNKDQIVLQGNKLNVGDDNYTTSNYSLMKRKASRAPRTGPLMPRNSSSVLRSYETLDVSEQPSNVNKPHSVSGTINRKCPLPEGPSSSPMAQWVGQRPQKISRTRRMNVVSPLLNSDEVHMSLKGCSPSDVGTGVTSTTVGGSLISKGAVNSTQLGKVRHENFSSQTRLLESEELGAGENDKSKVKEKRLGSNEVDERAKNNSCNISSSLLAIEKKKLSFKEEIGENLHKQGRNSRGSPVLKTGITLMNEKIEISTLTQPIRSMKPGSEKNGSKSGRPRLKKSRNRKAIARLGHPSTSHSPDIAGELDDDQEELLAAANFASNASYVGCSSSFWKKLEPAFAPVRLEDVACLKQLVKSTKEDQSCLSQSLGNNSQDGLDHKDNTSSQNPLPGEREKSVEQTDSKHISSMVDMLDQHLDVSFLCRQMNSEGNIAAPLYQRVLTALIIDDETDEETDGGGKMPFLCESDHSLGLACFPEDIENQPRTGAEDEFKSDMFSCNGNATHDQELYDFSQLRQVALHPETERLPTVSENSNGGLVVMNRVSSCSSTSNRHFEQMSMEDKLLLELQSVGLYPEPVPDLADEDCEAINQDIIQLQKGLHEQVTKKKEYFMKLIQAVEQGREEEQRALQEIAMNKLVELAYKKKLATRGSSAARNGIPKVSRPIALAFMKRTLARCRDFEESGRSCFLEPAFKDVLFAAPTCVNYAGSDVAVKLPLAQKSQQESPLPGLLPCRKRGALEKINHPSDLDSASIGNSFMGGANGKRSEKEREKGTSGRNSVTKSRSSCAGHSSGEPNNKAKPKQKATQLSTSGNESVSKLVQNNNSGHQLACGSNEDKAGSVPRAHITEELPILTEEPVDVTNLHELDSIELVVANELGGDEDLDSWLNIDEDLQEDVIGLDIPMDDLSELNMLL
ncbi:PREDICTED: uncharacterized protein LOC109336227 isoform X1 [Lupinus angustifolius]|uniref:uncharacterized protein LOC109336227 isoform X1 n=1 Tax=Lupinus angustifolius TaxID=3871 RepID=UPI00092F5BAF|nr:PREDICTED: uncharacterized protein LOC109336227 isoform X1 [Lupinus angustifolius]XP_019428235.1 PREDICTED: uncharacterized protein LOC109336227 isoform X1 [Lupinus angustifolius]XP_019428236.1 PREDICTED: uncharacterized protein LOC109336227 isoform X1 [Lupinus angustifolius]